MSSNHAKGRKRKATNIAQSQFSSNDDENKERRLAGEHRERFGIDSRFSAGRYAGGVRSRRSEHRIYCQRR
jgi:hypothetical protein